MHLQNSYTKAKAYIERIEGAVIYVTDKGRVKLKPEDWEKIYYKMYVKKGVVYVEEKGKQIEPIKEETRDESKGKSKRARNIQDLQGASNEVIT